MDGVSRGRPHQHGIDVPQQASDSTRNGLYIFGFAFGFGSNWSRGRRAARGIKLGRRRQRRVVDAPLLPGHEVVQEPVEVVREVRVVLDLVVRAQSP